jgi:transcription factor SPN1
MDDVKFDRSHSNSPLPEAGHDPSEPVQPDIDEENSTPNAPITDPYQDMEAAEDKPEMPDQEDEDGGLSDNDSALSDVDEAQFDDFEIGDIAVEERPAQMIDDSNLNLIGVHKRKRTEGEGEQPKKRKKKADKPRRKKDRDEGISIGDDSSARKGRRSKKEGRVRGASPDEEVDENLTPEERTFLCYLLQDNRLANISNRPETCPRPRYG